MKNLARGTNKGATAECIRNKHLECPYRHCSCICHRDLECIIHFQAIRQDVPRRTSESKTLNIGG